MTTTEKNELLILLPTKLICAALRKYLNKSYTRDTYISGVVDYMGMLEKKYAPNVARIFVHRSYAIEIYISGNINAEFFIANKETDGVSVRRYNLERVFIEKASNSPIGYCEFLKETHKVCKKIGEYKKKEPEKAKEVKPEPDFQKLLTEEIDKRKDNGIVW